MNQTLFPSAALETVRDVYGRLHYVESAQLRSAAGMLRLYHPDGRRLMTNSLGRTPFDWHGALLTRANICPHGQHTWLNRVLPDGSVIEYCPVCCPDLKEESK